jgi:hypothetical protein
MDVRRVKAYSLLCIKMLHPKVLVPDEYVLIRCHDVRVQKSLGVPPSGMCRNIF